MSSTVAAIRDLVVTVGATLEIVHAILDVILDRILDLILDGILDRIQDRRGGRLLDALYALW